VVFGGVAWYLGRDGGRGAVLALAAVALAMLISYERAKAEGLGYDARGGLMERAERMVLLGIGLAFDVLIPVLWIMVVLMSVTAVHRFVKVWRQASDLPARPRFLSARHQRPRSSDGAPAPKRWRSAERAADRRAVRAARRSRP
jgi:CDP-diacylglycerol--glycerol-3-phosphate 3-phosphatidyltransferase